MDEPVTTAPDTQPDVSTEAAADTAAPAADEGLEVKFNKQTHRLSREDAVRYAQMGMKYDSVEPLFKTLKALAAAEGKPLNEWVEGLKSRPAPTADEALTQRLADEYEALCREVPIVGAFAALPEAVLHTAVADGVPLLDAYLRWEYRERCRTEAEHAAARTAAAATTGSLAGEAVSTATASESAMLRGIWGRG